MNILILTPYLPYPLNSGGAQGMFNMIDHLRHLHHYTLVISEGSDYNPKYINALQDIWPEVDIIYYPLWKQLLYFPFFYEKARRQLLKKLAPNSRQLAIELAVRPYGEWFSKDHVKFVENIIQEKQIDLVQVEFYECISWSSHLPEHIKKVFIHHELGFIRKKRLLKGIALSSKEQKQLNASKQSEMSDLEKYDAIMTVTGTDKAILKQEGLKTPIYVSTLAINTPSFPYSVNSNHLTFVGGYGHLPNKEGMDWLINEVCPFLKNENLTLNIIGKSWPSQYEDCPDVAVRLKGFVEQLSDIALGSIMVVPILSGSGMRMKILEAAAMSLPIVTTTVGVEGLDFINGESCLVADTPEDFANAIIRLGKDEQLRKSLGEKANSVYQANYHPKVLAAKRNDIYTSIMQNN